MINAIYTKPNNDIALVQIDLEDYLNSMSKTTLDYSSGQKINKQRITING